MNGSKQDSWLAGVDGCAAGWIVVLVRPEGDDARIFTTGCFSDILTSAEAPAIVGVDMPIGLPRQSPAKGRVAESVVRPLLGDRKSSVFRIPSRSAVYAAVEPSPADPTERFFRACEIARDTSDDKKAFAKQGFYIFPKIVEIDQFLRNRREFVSRVFEIHPEMAFWRLNGNKPLDKPKKLKNRPHEPGLVQRRHLLIASGLPHDLVNAAAPRGAAADDLLDALACAAIARRIHDGVAKSFPDPPPPDEFGLPMAIWA
jgi:predicted RNase H-like nuclease